MIASSDDPQFSDIRGHEVRITGGGLRVTVAALCGAGWAQKFPISDLGSEYPNCRICVAIIKQNERSGKSR